MFGDTTARNRAHQQFGKEHYGLLIFIKALPWILAVVGLCFLVGPANVWWVVTLAVDFLAASNVRTALALFAFAALLWWVKRRWRRKDYLP